MNNIQSKFDQLYLKIINEHTGNNYTELNPFLKEVYPILNDYLDRYRIIDETVHSQLLTPVPEQLIKNICNNINKVNTNAYKITFRQIEKLIYNSQYLSAQTFKQNLLKYAKDINGSLYIIFIEYDQNEYIYDNKVFNLLRNVVKSDDLVVSFYNQILNKEKTINGLCVLHSYDQIQNYKDTLIFVNKAQTTQYFSFEDILDHQLTHFIQRVTGFAQDLTNIIKINYARGMDQEQIEIFKHFWDNDQERRIIARLIYDKFEPTELIETIKDVINFSIRYCKIKHINIETLIESFNNYSLYQQHKEQFKNYLKTKENQTINVVLIFINICYLIIKTSYKEYQIDQTLRKQWRLNNE